ncbi:hypothetical protein EG327_002077 [Venturia inaequalis]|uniref:F-box domain-containing protein n=1 Tax=Venturia inaequalis TaxID=5025 RepID=A0A8H3Z8C5_VENIN|nr:hypothetical protein EG327_002077 [Venturia inaequalis]
MRDSASIRNLKQQAPISPSFLDLPLELRREIYHYCLPPKPFAVCVGLFVPRYSLRSSPSTGLLSVSKQINDEALDILYGQALCKFDLHLQKGPHFGEYFSEENKQRVRRIRLLLDVDVDGDDDLDELRLVAGLDGSVLARLTKLEIVAALPGLSKRYPSAELVRAAREKWLKGFEELIEYIARATSPTLVIEVDDNDQEQTTAIYSTNYKNRPESRAMAEPNPQNPARHFLDLPLELRYEVYRHFFSRRACAPLHGRSHPQQQQPDPIALLLVAKSVSEEALDILYGESLYKINLPGTPSAEFETHITKRNMQRIRRVQLQLFRNKDSCVNGLGKRQLDTQTDALALAGITKLEIVPVAASWYSAGNPYCEEERQNWLQWFEGLVEYTRSKVSSTLRVELDNDDGEEATNAIVCTRHFPKRFRNVQTEAGDYYFCREDLGETCEEGYGELKAR